MTQVPFNIELLIPKDRDVKGISPVKVLDTFIGSTKNFHPEGLFSTEIFGKVGEESRNRIFSYINLNITVMHPLFFKLIVKLKAFYGDILSGKKFATFNTETLDFEPASPVDGDTGYSFFLSHIKELKLVKTDSSQREYNIALIEKYIDNHIIDKLVVMPAGIRDYFVDSTGTPSEDEVNGFYKRILGISNSIEGITVKQNLELLDSSRYTLQTVILDLYLYIEDLLKGKGKLIQGKWISRNIFNSTRNVLSSSIRSMKRLGDPNNVTSKQCIVGMHEYLRSTLPLTVKNIRDTYLSNIFVGSDSAAFLIDKKTLERVSVDIAPETYDEWMTYDGIEKTVAKFGISDIRHDVIEIEDHYLALLYNDGKGYRVVYDKNTIPEDLRVNLNPITLSELLYLSVYKGSDEIPGLITRYPITGYGSINLIYAYLRTTNKSLVLYELDSDLQPTPFIAKEFPIKDTGFFDTLNIPHRYLGRMGADFD